MVLQNEMYLEQFKCLHLQIASMTRLAVTQWKIVLFTDTESVALQCTLSVSHETHELVSNLCKVFR